MDIHSEGSLTPVGQDFVEKAVIGLEMVPDCALLFRDRLNGSGVNTDEVAGCVWNGLSPDPNNPHLMNISFTVDISAPHKGAVMKVESATGRAW